MGVAMIKTHPLTHLHVVNNTYLVFGNHMPNFSLFGRLINFWWPKQLSMGGAMTKTTHTHKVKNA